MSSLTIIIFDASCETVSPTGCSRSRGPTTAFTRLPRFKRRLESALQNPQGGTLSRGLSKADREIILSRLRQTPITVHVEPRTQHAHELNVLQPLWQEAIIGSVLLSATLVVRSIAITDRNRLAIERACELHGVPLLVRSVEGA